MRDGWFKIEGAFSREKAADWSQDVWTRLDMNPNDRSTWTSEWINMPGEASDDTPPFPPPNSRSALGARTAC